MKSQSGRNCFFFYLSQMFAKSDNLLDFAATNRDMLKPRHRMHVTLYIFLSLSWSVYIDQRIKR